MPIIIIVIFIASSPAGAGPDGGLYRQEDGRLVIEWSPDVGFSLYSPGSSVNGSLGVFANGSASSTAAVMEAEISTGSDGSAPAEGGRNSSGGSLEADISSRAIGRSHLGWASWNPWTDGRGRHQEYGRKTTDLVGVFSIDMAIKLGSGVGPSPGSADWIPCL
ncbi:hypothetical protein [Candidatus Methanocrinis natronophilus]|uniref:Uncharacterized protein n=1 Tax=Candidatus Methanocrinis natronophilus TaxID=3033396 RepID=A0ABT5X9X3_9EURY|nr:hypothetical protein [Candidatus Methanocrinis natronophilus]MDF0591514.1 hypothetical protein [Candidatus Methanocrinis natronophilus]